MTEELLSSASKIKSARTRLPDRRGSESFGFADTEAA